MELEVVEILVFRSRSLKIVFLVHLKQKRLESLTEAEMEALYEQVEEEKRQLGGEQVK